MNRTPLMYEESVIAAMFLEPAHAIPVATSILQPEDFTEKRYKVLYNTLYDMFEASQPIDMISLYNELDKRGDIENAGGPMVIANIGDYVSTARNVEIHAAIVRDNATRRRMALQVGNASALINMETEDIDDIVDGLEQAIETAQDRIHSKQSFKDVFREAITDLQDRSERGIEGLYCGYRPLDDKIGGFFGGEFIVLAGRPSTGKTSIMVDMARHMQRQGPVGIFSLEMSRKEVVYRILSAEAQINSGNIRRAKLSDGQWATVASQCAEIENLKIYIEDQGITHLSSLTGMARQWKQRHGITCLFVDYLQLIEVESENRQQEVAVISKKLKHLAKALDIPVITLAQLNRGTEVRNDGRPKLSDLRDSGAIEQDADIVLLIYRPGNYDENNDKSRTEIIVAKNRNGEIGEIELIFESQYATFREAELWETEV